MSRARANSIRSHSLSVRGLRAAGRSDTGLQREVNEDRFHIDLPRGLFIVIDGVGGHAAGGKAADVALQRLRERLERETGPVTNRIREAIAIANNEICRLASTRPEWDGMACVLTVAVLENGQVTIGHVGDTRLYKLRAGVLEKVTRDHSPVGEREDAGELAEGDAMRHPRRNEVYRDVGSDPHDPADADFVDIQEIAFESDAALLLCSDGLTDLVDAATVSAIVSRCAGSPDTVATALIDAANAAGGKDNVTVVYAEGEDFAPQPMATAEGLAVPWRRPDGVHGSDGNDQQSGEERQSGGRWGALVRSVTLGLLLIVAGVALDRVVDWPRVLRTIDWLPGVRPAVLAPAVTGLQVVDASSSIAAALARATAGSQIVVEPGEYREQLFLKDGVRVVSRVPGAASLRLPANGAEGAAVVASNLASAEFAGFRIVGDAKTPLGTGIFIDNSALLVSDVEVTGATRAGVEFAGGGTRAPTLLASDIHDNPGAALVIRRAAAPRVVHNTFRRNGLSEHVAGALSIDAGAAPLFRGNVFVGFTADAFAALEQSTRLPLSAENWFIAPADPVRSGRPARPPQGKR
jgi:serine/threonine protein phosphatase PrpC